MRGAAPTRGGGRRPVRTPPADHRADGRPALIGGFALSLGVLTAASFVSVGFSANAPLIQHSLALSHAAIGAIASAVYGAAAVTSAVAGRCTDRIGPGPVLVAAMTALAGGVVLAVTARQPLTFFAGLAVCGLGYGAVNPPTNVLTNPASPLRRGLAMSGKQSGIPLGGVLAGAALPPVAASVGWRWSMQLPALLCAALAVLAVTVRRDRARQSVAGPVESRRTTVRLRLPRAYAFGFLMAGVQVTIFAFLALYLTEDRGLNTAAAGVLLALLMVGGLVGRPLWGWVSDRRHQDRIRILQAVTLLSGAGLLLVPILPLPALNALVVAAGFCSVGWNGVYIASVAEAAPADMVGSSTGTALVLVNVGAVMLPPTFGVLVARYGWATAWDVYAGLSLFAAVALQVSRLHVPAPVAAQGAGA